MRADQKILLAALAVYSLALTSTVLPFGTAVVAAVLAFAACRVARGTPECSLGVLEDGRLALDGGSVEHVLATLDPADFPAVPGTPAGTDVVFPTPALRDALATVRAGQASAPSRYALDAVLVERDHGRTNGGDTDGDLECADDERLVLTHPIRNAGAHPGHLFGHVGEPSCRSHFSIQTAPGGTTLVIRTPSPVLAASFDARYRSASICSVSGCCSTLPESPEARLGTCQGSRGRNDPWQPDQPLRGAPRRRIRSVEQKKAANRDEGIAAQRDRRERWPPWKHPGSGG